MRSDAHEEESNPVVLLCGDVWHIVESSRASRRALCGAELRDRRAHSRLHTVGREHICPVCLRLNDEQQSPDARYPPLT